MDFGMLTAGDQPGFICGNGRNTGDLAVFGSGGAGGAVVDGDPTCTMNGGDAVGGAMTRRHDRAWVWMIGAFGGALALAAAVVAGYGTDPDGLGLGLRVTARWSFLFFWLSYAGGAMATLFGPAFAGLARQARALGLAFAAALQVHIGLVVWLGVVTGQIPLAGGDLWFFVVALFLTYQVALLSFGIGVRNLGRLWRPLLFLATTYILIAFGKDFVPAALDQTQDWFHAAAYVPFALLSVIAIPLRFAAFLRRRFGLRSATA
jgi:hypothetical protein